MTTQPTRERMLDLLCDRALSGLRPEEDEELGRLLVDFDDGASLGREIEHAAAAVALANLGAISEMPRKLQELIESEAIDLLPTRIHRGVDLAAAVSAALGTPAPESEPETARPEDLARRSGHHGSTVPFPQGIPVPLPPLPPAAHTSPMVQPAPMPPPRSAPSLPAAMVDPRPSQLYSPNAPMAPVGPQAAPPVAPRSGRTAVVVAIAGWLAAAACLALAGAAWYTRQRAPIVVATTAPTQTQSAPSTAPPPPSGVAPAPPTSAAPGPSSAEERARLLARSGTQHGDWFRGKDAAGKQASGDVVWSAAEQRGYMRIRGLPKNDRLTSTYQLWIFDKDRDEKYPVDGGIFDVDDDTNEIVVAIQPKLVVSSATTFAITIEKPGGVVVSKRDHLVLIAKTT
jgi:hypothetical protein